MNAPCHRTPPDIALHQTRPASMEPRPGGRGMPPAAGLHKPSALGFNGATSRRTWNEPPESVARIQVDSLQWSHVPEDVECINTITAARHRRPGFNGATSRRTWNDRAANRQGLPPRGFNGATSRRTWNGISSMRGRRMIARASMEPRPGGRGMATECAHAGVNYRASMEPRPGGRGMSNAAL